jgi:ATP-dependent DNA helicase 2 subunit 1
MSGWKNPDDEDEEEQLEEEEDEEVYETKKDSLIFAVDCSDSMFSSLLDEKIEPFYLGLKSIVNTYCDKIISNSTDTLGVVLYNTKEKLNSFDFGHIYILSSIDEPNATTIKMLDSIVTQKDISKFGASQQKARFDEVLWSCQQLFSHTSQKTVGFRRIIIFTNDENPSAPEHVKKCSAKAMELKENGISITPIFLKKKETGFNSGLFWRGLEIVDVDTDTGRRGGFDYVDKINQLTDTVKYKEYKKRAYGSTELSIGDDIKIGVSLYTMIHKEPKPSAVTLGGKLNHPLKTNTKWLDETTGTPMVKQDIYSYWMYGDPKGTDKVVFSPTEVASMKKLCDKGIRILGFKPRSRLKDFHNYRSSIFLYPNDETIENSSTAMAALQKKMIEMEKIAICRFLDRDSSVMSYCAMIPQREVIVDGQQKIPPGFNLVFIPYAEGFRTIEPMAERIEVDDNQVLKAKVLIGKLGFRFDSVHIDNPTLQHHYGRLQALALGKDKEEPFEDSTLPYIDDFKDAVFPFDYEPEQKKTTYKPKSKVIKKVEEDEPTTSGKRKKAPSDDDEDEPKKKATPKKAPAKKVKKEPKEESTEIETVEEEDEIDMKEEVRSGHIEKLTIPVLKAFCSENGLSQTGVKKVLIDRIKQFIQDHLEKKAAKKKNSLESLDVDE